MDRTEKLLMFLGSQPPSETRDVFDSLTKLSGSVQESLSQMMRFPLDIADDVTTGKHFIICEFNRISDDIYRTPWTSSLINVASSAYHGPHDALNLPMWLRRLEIAFNELYLAYCSIYFGSSSDTVSSVYMWTAARGFNGVFLSRKRTVASEQDDADGAWDSVHILKCEVLDDCTFVSVYSSVQAHCEFSVAQGSEARARLEACKERTTERSKVEVSRSSKNWEESVVERVGEVLEDNENVIRRQLECFHFEKCVSLLDSETGAKASYAAHPIFATLNKDSN